MNTSPATATRTRPPGHPNTSDVAAPGFVPPPPVDGPSTAQASAGAPATGAQAPAQSATVAPAPLYGTDPSAQRNLILSLELRAVPGLR